MQKSVTISELWDKKTQITLPYVNGFKNWKDAAFIISGVISNERRSVFAG
jgi:hypothetical protein